MEQVENAVGKRDAFSGRAPFVNALSKLATAQDFVRCAQ
jgi:hypothetical protein